MSSVLRIKCGDESLISHKRDGYTQWQSPQRYYALFLEPTSSSKIIGSIEPKTSYYLTGEFLISEFRFKQWYQGQEKFSIPSPPLAKTCLLTSKNLFRKIWMRAINHLGKCGWFMTDIPCNLDPGNLDERQIATIIDRVIFFLTTSAEYKSTF